MKATELRIGNLYHYHISDSLDAHGEWNEISVIDAQDILYLERNPDDANYIGIILTPEILEKCGIIKVGSNYEREWLLLHPNKVTGTFDLLLSEPHSSKYHVTTLNYLHQLQNIWFELSGEELDVTAIKESGVAAKIKMEELKVPLIYTSLTNSLIEKAFIKLNQTLEGLLIEGLKRKGLEFNHNSFELIDFIKKNCRVEDAIHLQQRTYFVNDIPFFQHNYKAAYSSIGGADTAYGARITLGTYKFL